MRWNDGYVTDTPYTAGVFMAQSPAHLNHAAVLGGCEPVPLDRPYTYFELGFGQGLTLNALAAANPLGQFHGADFMPAHVAEARDFANRAGIDNVHLLENSFADLAAGKVELPRFDFITMHGVYSWVSAQARGEIVAFIERYLKPGGIVYVSYNAMPGWAAALPLQRLMLELCRLRPADASHAQIDSAREFIGRLEAVEAAFINAHPDLQRRLESLRTDRAAYLSHEYLNENWQPLYHCDVAGDFRRAQLEFVGSALPCNTFWRTSLTQEQLGVVEAVADPALRETVKDIVQNASFRCDVFVRGARPMSPVRRTAWLRKTRLALTVPRAHVNLDLGRTESHSVIVKALLDALEQGPKSLGELSDLPCLGGALDVVLQVAALLDASSQAAVCAIRDDAAAADDAATGRLNRVLAFDARERDQFQALASPVLGSGLKSGLLQRLVYACLAEQPDDVDAARIADDIQKTLAAHPDAETSPAEPALTASFVRQAVAQILALRLPVWRQLAML
jgi:SAM-dependent methyltransferase